MLYTSEDCATRFGFIIGSQFVQLPWVTHVQSAYDIDSIMHYPSLAGAVPASYNPNPNDASRYLLSKLINAHQLKLIPATELKLYSQFHISVGDRNTILRMYP